jgi:hypothetical protein
MKKIRTAVKLDNLRISVMRKGKRGGKSEDKPEVTHGSSYRSTGMMKKAIFLAFLRGDDHTHNRLFHAQLLYNQGRSEHKKHRNRLSSQLRVFLS